MAAGLSARAYQSHCTAQRQTVVFRTTLVDCGGEGNGTRTSVSGIWCIAKRPHHKGMEWLALVPLDPPPHTHRPISSIRIMRDSRFIISDDLSCVRARASSVASTLCVTTSNSDTSTDSICGSRSGGTEACSTNTPPSWKERLAAMAESNHE